MIIRAGRKNHSFMPSWFHGDDDASMSICDVSVLLRMGGEKCDGMRWWGWDVAKRDKNKRRELAAVFVRETMMMMLLAQRRWYKTCFARWYGKSEPAVPTNGRVFGYVVGSRVKRLVQTSQLHENLHVDLQKSFGFGNEYDWHRWDDPPDRVNQVRISK